jgi:hypothetical protein
MEIQYYFSLFVYTLTSNNWLCLLKQSSPPFYDNQWKDWTNFWCVIVYTFFLSIWKIVIKAFSSILDVLWMVLSIMLFSYEEYVDENPYLGICRLVMDTKYHTLSVEIERFPSIFPYQIFYKCLNNKHIEFCLRKYEYIYIYIELLCLLN